jgi:ADP-ribose pyrophosphatase YjhB (NUDIX family)
MFNMKDTPLEVPFSQWNKFNDPRPVPATLLFAFDSNGNFPILWRGNNVRSVKNCWSLPGGLHEIGMTLGESSVKELKEELNLEADPASVFYVGAYDNIVYKEKWHWLVHLLAVPLRGGAAALKNMEPDKHDKVEMCNLHEFIYCRDPHSPNLKNALLLYEKTLLEYANKITSVA